jgi:hypothetical protein
MNLKETIESKMLKMGGYYSESEAYKDSLNEIRRECLNDVKEAVLELIKIYKDNMFTDEELNSESFGDLRKEHNIDQESVIDNIKEIFGDFEND